MKLLSDEVFAQDIMKVDFAEMEARVRAFHTQARKRQRKIMHGYMFQMLKCNDFLGKSNVFRIAQAVVNRDIWFKTHNNVIGREKWKLR